MKEGERLNLDHLAGLKENKDRQVIEIDSFEKYDRMRERYGDSLESRTMSKPVVSQYIEDVNFRELDLVTFTRKQNLTLDNFFAMVNKNRETQTFSDRTLFYYYFNSVKTTDEDFTRMVDFYIDATMSDEKDKLAQSLIGYDYNLIILSNEISYEVAKESLIRAIDTWMTIPIEDYKKRSDPHLSYLLLAMRDFVDYVSYAIKKTYVIPKADRDFITDYLFAGKIIKEGKIEFFGNKVLRSPYNEMHKSFFQEDLVSELYDQIVKVVGPRNFLLETNTVNPYINPKYFEHKEEEITLDTIKKILDRIGSDKTGYLIDALFASKAELADEVVEKFRNTINLEELIKNKSACEWFEKQGLTETMFKGLLAAASSKDEGMGRAHKFGRLEVTRDQIVQYLEEAHRASYDPLELNCVNLKKLTTEDIEKYCRSVVIDLVDVKNVSELPTDLLVSLMTSNRLSKSRILRHSSSTADNPISLNVTKRIIETGENALESVYNDIISGFHYEIDDEILKIMIGKMKCFGNEFDFITKIDGKLNDLIDLFSREELE